MRHNLAPISLAEPTPCCPACGGNTLFTQTADLGRDGRLYLIFRCPACDRGEIKVWRASWQGLKDLLIEEE